MFSFFLTTKIVIGLEDKCLGLLSKMESTKSMRQIYEKNTLMSFLCRSLLLGDGPEGHFLWHLAGLHYYWL
jgi:hypothetical protein